MATDNTLVPITSLSRGDQFIGPNDTWYEVLVPASEHEHRGWVDVTNLSMTDEQAAARLAEPGAVEPGCDPRHGFFDDTEPVYVRRLGPDDRAEVLARIQTIEAGPSCRTCGEPLTPEHFHPENYAAREVWPE